MKEIDDKIEGIFKEIKSFEQKVDRKFRKLSANNLNKTFLKKTFLTIKYIFLTFFTVLLVLNQYTEGQVLKVLKVSIVRFVESEILDLLNKKYKK